MKKLHIFLLKSFLGPLVATFFISLFILVLQFLWKYVDDMVGKGLEWYVLAELLFYASFQVVSMALPLAILLASLMTFGNMGENYELTAMKSAGISLPRIMAPLLVLVVLISYGAFRFSNDLLPVVNLKLSTLLYDIRQARPELDIKQKVFYNGIEGFSIKIDRKNRETGMLYDLMIYDRRDETNRNTNVTLADSGLMQISADKKFVVFSLFSGVRYDEKTTNDRRPSRPRDKQAFRTDKFSSQTVLISLIGYDFSRTNEGLFSSSDKMKNLSQLIADEDSIVKIRTGLVGENNTMMRMNYFVKERYNETFDSVTFLTPIDTAVAVNSDSIWVLFNEREKYNILSSALQSAQQVKASVSNFSQSIESTDLRIRRHQIETHRKFTLPFSCLVFFLIGAPLGAIIRKGGLGVPVVISVFFFVIYYIVTSFGEKMAKEGLWQVWSGMWMATFVLLPIGLFLTYKSATDSALLNSDAYVMFFKKLIQFIRKKPTKS